MSMNWRKNPKYRGFDIIDGSRTIQQTGEWCTKAVDTASGRLLYEERTIPAPGGRAALQRRNGRLNGIPVDNATVNDAVLQAAIPYVLGDAG